jgi:hypothetical protein
VYVVGGWVGGWRWQIWQTRGAGEGRGLFLGSKFPSRDRKALDDLHIRHILNVTWEVTNEFEDSDDFTYHRSASLLSSLFSLARRVRVR